MRGPQWPVSVKKRTQYLRQWTQCYPAVLHFLARSQGCKTRCCHLYGLRSVEQLLLCYHHRILRVHQVLAGNFLCQLGHLRGGESDVPGDLHNLLPQVVVVTLNSDKNVADEVVVLAGQNVAQLVDIFLYLIIWEIKTLQGNVIL